MQLERRVPHEIPAWAGRGLLHVVIDTPRGSRNKYKFVPDWSCFRLGRVLPRGLSFPYDFGSIPSTAAEDGDPLDLMVLAETPTFVGCLVCVRLLGVIQAEQTEKRKTIRNDRLLGVPVTPVNPPAFQRLADVPERDLGEIESFFVAYNRAHGRKFEPLGRRGAREAERLVRAAQRRYEREAGRS